MPRSVALSLEACPKPRSASGQLLIFVFDANRFVVSIIAAYFSELSAANDALGFKFPLGGSTKAGPRNGQEAAGFDGAARQFADAIGAAADAVQSSLDLVKGTLLGGEHAQGPIAVVGISGGIGQMLAQNTALAADVGVLGQCFLLGENFIAEPGEVFAMARPLGIHLGPRGVQAKNILGGGLGPQRGATVAMIHFAFHVVKSNTR